MHLLWITALDLAAGVGMQSGTHIPSAGGGSRTAVPTIPFALRTRAI